MHRRLLVVATAIVVGAAAAASASPATSLFPSQGCVEMSDPPGDATLAPSDAPAKDPSAAGFDFTGASYRATPDVLTITLNVPGLKDLPVERGLGDEFQVAFTTNKHVVSLTASRISASSDVNAQYSYGYFPLSGGFLVPLRGVRGVAVDGADQTGAVFVGGEFDNVRGQVRISVNRPDLERFVGPIETVTGTVAHSYPRVGASTSLVDTGAWLDEMTQGQAPVIVDDNRCYS